MLESPIWAIFCSRSINKEWLPHITIIPKEVNQRRSSEDYSQSSSDPKSVISESSHSELLSVAVATSSEYSLGLYL